MHKRSTYRVLALLLALGMLFSMFGTTTVRAANAEPQAKITVAPEVLTEMEAKGTASYWIEFAAKADLSAAYKMGWSERGWYVYETLSQAAKTSQARVAAYLENSKVAYKSYWIKNTILVESSNLTTLNGLLGFSEIAAITPRHTFILYEPDTTQAVADNGVKAIEPNLTHINADDVWAMGIDGSGLVVANIDTGVRYSHQALVGQYRGNQGGGVFNHNYNWFNPDNLGDNVPRDGHGHGTHTMGTMVGDDGGSNQIGIAPGAKWMACAGCPDGSCTDSALLGCGQFIAAPTDLTGANANPDMRPNAVNNSWGDCGQTYDDWYAGPITAWQAAGIYPIFSNGNSSNCGYSSPPGLNTVGNPARSGNVTGVGSSGEQNGQYATHSNWGPTDDPDTINPTGGYIYMKPQVLAPGVSIRSSVPTSDTSYEDGWSGTSMSAPHVTGLVALLWQAAPCLIGDYAVTENIIEETAVDMVYNDGSSATPGDFPNYATGWGEIDALAAVNYASGICAMGTLQGTVTTDGTTPLAGAKIFADNGAGYTKSIYSSADGTYSTGLPEGTYTLTASKYGYDTVSYLEVEVVEGQTTTQDFVLAPLGTTVVSGVVYDGGVDGVGYHGYPLYASIHITANSFDETIYTDPFTGYYEIELVADTVHTFTTTALVPGYGELGEDITPSGAATVHDIALKVEPEACAAPGYKPDYDYFYSFETSDEGFTPGGTTSFAWGDFTSGPGEGHSGTKGIATNPAGEYNASELGWMVSPVIDLSGNGTNPTAIQWWDWKHIESASYDWAQLDVTKDGGTTWNTVWGPVGGVSDTSYSQQTVLLDSSYNVSNFQFRFYFKSDTSVQYEGWYVDDVGVVSIPLPPPTTVFSSSFDADNGGFVASGANSTWAWGAPTTGPGAPYSPPNVWATNLSGNYNDREDSFITSPLIDLSAYAGLAPTISFMHWYSSESNTYDWGAVEATKDGGLTWDTLWQKFGTYVNPWTSKSIQLDPSYAVSNFQFRFHFLSDSSVNYPGWYIDDVAVTVNEPVVVAPPCTLIPGGVVAGYVYDANDNSPLVGADVYSAEAATQTIYIPEDPASEGFYWVFQPFTGLPPKSTLSVEAHDFTAEKALYGSQTETVSVEQDSVTQQDFFLGTGALEFDPTSFEANMMMGDPAYTETLTITNTGTSDAMFELVEKDEGFEPPLSIPAFTDALPEDTRPVSIGRAPEAVKGAGQDKAGSGLAGILAGSPAFAVDVYPGYNVVNIPDVTVPGVWNIVGGVGSNDFFAGDFVGGDFSTLYAVDYNTNRLYAVNTANGAATLIGPTTPPSGQTFSGVTGTPDGTLYGLVTDCATSNLATVDTATGATTLLGALPGITCGIDLAYNTDDDMIYIVDIASDSLFKVNPATLAVTLVGSLGVNANYAQGMDYDETAGILYWAAYSTSGELRVIDTATGASALVGAFPSGAETDCLAIATGGVSDVPWLSEDPTSGTVPVGGSVEVDIVFDPTGAGLNQPGDYLAALKIKHDTPSVYPNIPVILHLAAPSTFGTLNGTVKGMEACDVNPAPLAGATVNFWQDGSVVYTTSTNASGYYTYTVPAGLYDIEVVAAGYVSIGEEDVEIVGGSTATMNFDLRLLAPCLSVVPTELEQSQVADTVTTQTLTVVNSGAQEGSFELIELPAAGILADQLIQDPSFELYTDPSSPWEQYSENYGTPLCTVDDCGTGTGTGPHTGDVWSWFGGSSSGDTGYVSQDVLILPGTAEMTFYVEQYVCGTAGASNYLALKIDGTEIWRTDGSDPACGVLGYRLVTVDVSDFADGDTHEIKFDSVTVDSGNFFVDDVELNLDAGGDVPWLAEDPIAGTVPADSSLNVTITYDSTGLVLGDYHATLRVKNPPAPAINVPVTLHVIDVYSFFIPLLFK
ncbi:MAG: S8 family serine peptidase [Anaerolineaceae bacterium]|nr:S8 family serine peptidase [Anaerolineaceae bacterium]HOE35758.1 S8 family serine peptidase [Anaerolineaceae bacterium]